MHKNFEKLWRNAWDKWMQSWQLPNPKFNQEKLSQFETTLNFFWGWDFSTFFFNSMPLEYQYEKSPIMNGQKNPKTLGKVQKMMWVISLRNLFTNCLQTPCKGHLFFSFCFFSLCKGTTELYTKVRPTCFQLLHLEPAIRNQHVQFWRAPCI